MQDNRIADATRAHIAKQEYPEKITAGIKRLFALADEPMDARDKMASISAIDKALRHMALQMEFIMPRMRDVVVTNSDANKPISQYSNAELVAIISDRGASAAGSSGVEPTSVH